MPPAPTSRRVKRLNSLNKSAPGQRPQGPKGPKSTNRPSASKSTCCSSPLPEDDGDGHIVCKNCYTQVSESNIVSDVTFQEDSRGAATVQGGFIGENARHARSSAAMRRTGGGEKNSLQDIEGIGRRALGSLCPKLGIPEATSNQALRLYTLAVHNHNFAAGRRTDEVIGACLYAACRRQKDNAVLLIDIAELQRLNVFRLGEVYKSMCQELYLDAQGGVGTQYLLEVESLVMKYCRRLEFEEATRQVAEDAVKIIRRMKRDWIITGRHPAGLCGAAIILAARMNNFRRSVREIVYVAKVADLTVYKRVEEFRRTKSAALTVEQFREYGVRLKEQHDPPVLYESQLNAQRLEKKKRKRQAASEGRETIEISDNGSNASSRESSIATPDPVPQLEIQNGSTRKRRRTNKDYPGTPAATQPEIRRDADGFVIPALPVDAVVGSEKEQEDAAPKRGRPKKGPPQPIVITNEELETEAELEFDINDALNDDEIIDSRNELEKAKDEQRAKTLAEQKKKDEAEKDRLQREAGGTTWLDTNGWNTREEINSEELEKIFENDPEVQNCQLSVAEAIIKEQIWLRENEDWLRIQHEKFLVRQIAGTDRTNKFKKKNKTTVKRKQRGKMGDGTTLAEATTPIDTPADASIAMLDARATTNYSKWINYDILRKVYSPSTASVSRRSTTPGASATASIEGSPPSGEPTDARDTESTSPSPAETRNRTVRLQSPPITQQASTPKPSPALPPAVQTAPPPSPLQTQVETVGGAEDVESEGDEDDYVQDDGLDYGEEDGSPFGWGREDDREDIGEEDYQRAIDPTGDIAIDDDYDDDGY